MDRFKYLESSNYKKIHDYLTNLLLEIETKVVEYLINNSLFDYLVKTTVNFGKMYSQTNIVSYSILFDFFEEAEMPGFREYQVSFILSLRIHSCFEKFDYLGSEIENSGNIISKISINKDLQFFPKEIKHLLNDIPKNIIPFIGNFLKHELNIYLKNKELFDEYRTKMNDVDKDDILKLIVELYTDVENSPFINLQNEIKQYLYDNKTVSSLKYIEELDIDSLLS